MYKRQVEYYKKATEVDPSHFFAYNNIALSLKKSDKIEIFEKDLKVKKPWVFND